MISISELSPKKRIFLTGTILLTSTGFACRALGFFYRIFLSRTIGAEGLGVYNMIHPIFGICFALCAGSIQTALSQHIASQRTFHFQNRYCYFYDHVLCAGLSDLPSRRISGKRCFDGTALCAFPSCNGDLRALCSLPCLHQRLLLRYAEIPCSRLLPGGGTDYPHGRRISHCRLLDFLRAHHYRYACCLRTLSRRSCLCCIHFALPVSFPASDRSCLCRLPFPGHRCPPDGSCPSPNGQPAGSEPALQR